MRRPDAVLQAINRAATSLYHAAGNPLPIRFFALGAHGFAAMTGYEPAADIKSFFRAVERPSAADDDGAEAELDQAAEELARAEADDGDTDEHEEAAFPDATTFHQPAPAVRVVFDDGLPPEARATTLFRYFKRQRTGSGAEDGGTPAVVRRPDDERPGSTYTCPQCFKRVRESERTEHDDYHVAARMQREWARETPT
eukprot:Unigene1706_Nuclearia_a/m.5247 Unigene1706_Nuclearia_a/g.5247  ORF Unigene1706_Nuclearia_a/g.5247 Unigene1706_Nuclearia_a/m.5247 type:complete len:198 (-) Unigene1706_Nuclearia_a:40-633(-)